MIASLKGILDSAGEDWAVVDVGGVGYLVFCSGRTLAAMPAPGEAVALRIETHVREDHIHLYGFVAKVERDWFCQLVTVQGVGARVALAILGVLTPTEIAGAIATGDKAALGRASGVGPKLANRIATELKDKAGVLEIGSFDPGSVSAGTKDGPKGEGEGNDQVIGDAVSALVHLGYGRTEAFGAVIEASRTLGADAALATLIQAGLSRLGTAA